MEMMIKLIIQCILFLLKVFLQHILQTGQQQGQMYVTPFSFTWLYLPPYDPLHPLLEVWVSNDDSLQHPAPETIQQYVYRQYHQFYCKILIKPIKLHHICCLHFMPTSRWFGELTEISQSLSPPSLESFRPPSSPPFVPVILGGRLAYMSSQCSSLERTFD